MAWRAEEDRVGTPRWLPISVAIGVATSTVSLWQALIAESYAPFALLPAVVLGGGCLLTSDLRVDCLSGRNGHTRNPQPWDEVKRARQRPDSALDCILTIDHEGCMTEFNRAAERSFGYRREEVVGKQLADIIVPLLS